uniref:phosphoethanolamine N-methyltransferase n=1 Tax=Plectus sambesii TaxID=2011161 RepID=A0A914VIW5_9BILA
MTTTTTVDSELANILYDRLHLHSSDAHIAVVGDEAFAICDKKYHNVSHSDTVGGLSSYEHCDAILAANVLNDHDLYKDNSRLNSLIRSLLHRLLDGGFAVVSGTVEDGQAVARLTHFFDVFRSDGEHDTTIGFEFIEARNLSTEVQQHQNWLRMVWVLRRTQFESHHEKTFRDFLDNHQYKGSCVDAYEWIFGPGFISPGGAKENLHYLEKLQINSNQRMLDIGVGIGGSAMQVAQTYGAEVVGIDLSSNMIAVALDRAQKVKNTKVSFVITDVLKVEFAAASFDFVYSRDCIHHIPDSKKLFGRIYQWLKPHGKVMITVYSQGPGVLSEKFKNYVKEFQYNFHTLQEYTTILKGIGFGVVAVDDVSDRLKATLQNEIDKFEQQKDEFISKFSEEKYNVELTGWHSKIGYINEKNLVWAQIYAVKS